jgi:hypothetical protein
MPSWRQRDRNSVAPSAVIPLRPTSANTMLSNRRLNPNEAKKVDVGEIISPLFAGTHTCHFHNLMMHWQLEVEPMAGIVQPRSFQTV